MEREIILHPRYFGRRLMEILTEKLVAEVEGKCFGNYGYIISVTSVEHVGPGFIRTGMGSVTFPVTYTAIVFRPSKGEVVDAVVTEVNKVGIFAEIGPVSCFVSRHSMPEEMKYSATAATPCYRSGEGDVSIGPGDEIRIKVIGTRVDAFGIFTVGTINDDYLGLLSF